MSTIRIVLILVLVRKDVGASGAGGRKVPIAELVPDELVAAFHHHDRRETAVAQVLVRLRFFGMFAEVGR